MPVRKIKKSYRQVTGVLSSKKNNRMVASESTLERDLYLILDFDPMVKFFEEQPVSIPYVLSNDKKSRYTPDCLIELDPKPEFIWRYSPFRLFYSNDDYDRLQKVEKPVGSTTLLPKTSMNVPRNILVEVKYRTDLIKDWQVLKPKFKAARKFAADKNWQFRILTEVEIKTQLLDNIKFMRLFRRHRFTIEQIRLVMNKLTELEVCTPEQLLKSITDDIGEQGHLLPVIWQLVAAHEIGVEWNKPINMSTNLYLFT